MAKNKWLPVSGFTGLTPAPKPAAVPAPAPASASGFTRLTPTPAPKAAVPAPAPVRASAPVPADIARLAYELWEKDGCPHGKDKSYWFKAEQTLKKKPGF
ncbi:MAG: DUF2934 domain-containing protein [Planctomycetota bacterium]